MITPNIYKPTLATCGLQTVIYSPKISVLTPPDTNSYSRVSQSAQSQYNVCPTTEKKQIMTPIERPLK